MNTVIVLFFIQFLKTITCSLLYSSTSSGILTSFMYFGWSSCIKKRFYKSSLSLSKLPRASDLIFRKSSSDFITCKLFALFSIAALASNKVKWKRIVSYSTDLYWLNFFQLLLLVELKTVNDNNLCLNYKFSLLNFL